MRDQRRMSRARAPIAITRIPGHGCHYVWGVVVTLVLQTGIEKALGYASSTL